MGYINKRLACDKKICFNNRCFYKSTLYKPTQLSIIDPPYTSMLTMMYKQSSSRVPMSSLFPGADGNVRTVTLSDTAEGDGMLCYCCQDIIQYVCSTSEKRAASIWNNDISSKVKAKLTFKIWVFHRKPIAVMPLKNIMLLINALNSGKAVIFCQQFIDIIQCYVKGAEIKEIRAMDAANRGLTFISTPMSSLFPGANGNVRTVTLSDTAEGDGMLCYCCQDIIQYVCSTSEKRAASIWNNDISSKVKAKLTFKIWVFHRKPIAVMTLKEIMLLINALNSGTAVVFRQRFMAIIQRYVEGDTTLFVEIDENKAMGVEAATGKLLAECHADAIQAEEEEETREGFIYGAVSDAFPGHIKIGFTYDLQQRLADANTFCALKPFHMAVTARTTYPRRAEARAHARFAPYRRAGEFFEMQVDELQRYMMEAV